jgi:hypothetical protein
MNLKENMKRFNTKNLNEQEMSYDQKVDKMKSTKKINAEQLKKIIPSGTTATIMNAEGSLLVVDENNNYYELV